MSNLILTDGRASIQLFKTDINICNMFKNSHVNV